MDAWPLFSLRIRHPLLHLALPPNEHLDFLATRAAGNVLQTDNQHFMGAWASLPSPEFERGMVQYHWTQMASWRASNWHLACAIYPENAIEDIPSGMPVGCMTLVGLDFANSRVCNTGSWILPQARGLGLGRAARESIVEFSNRCLHAHTMRSSAAFDNAASNAVSRGLGYHENGIADIPAGNGWRATRAWRLPLDEWTIRSHISIDGWNDDLGSMFVEE